MNYYEPTPKKRFNWDWVLLPFLTLFILIGLSVYLEERSEQRVKDAEKVSTIPVLESVEKTINKEIVQHYEKIDSLIVVRDSVVTEHSTKTVIQLQQSIDSIFNRQSDLPLEARSN